jgi:hypothetical protein
MKRFIVFLFAAMACMAVASTALAVPPALQYQGRLTDAAGEPLNSAVTVTFSLYGEESEGEPLWSQVWENLTLDNGRFNVILGGEDAPFTDELLEHMNGGGELWLGIKVGNDEEMVPRQAIASVAYALVAGQVENASEGGTAHADTADYAEFAAEAETAAHADTADFAEFAAEAETAAHADTADFAEFAAEAETAAHADTADYAEFAGEAGTAETAAVADSVPGLTGIAYEKASSVNVSVGAKTSIMSVDVVTEETGYVLVTVTGTFLLDNVNGAGVTCQANSSTSRNSTPSADMGFIETKIPATDLRLVHTVPFTSQRVFAKSSGTKTYYFNVYNAAGDRRITVDRPSMTAVFIAKAAGTVLESLPAPPTSSARISR